MKLDPGQLETLKELAKKIFKAHINGPGEESRDLITLALAFGILSEAVEKHYSNKDGHDCCWENDELLYQTAGLSPRGSEKPPIDQHRQRCDLYRASLYQVPVEMEPYHRVRDDGK